MPPANGSSQPRSTTAEIRRKNAPWPRLAEDHHMQALRSMRAPDDGLLDIRRARRAADQIDGARHFALAIKGAQRFEGFLVAADDVAGVDQDKMSLWQEGKRGRIVCARDEEQRAGLSRRGDSSRQSSSILWLGTAGGTLQG